MYTLTAFCYGMNVREEIFFDFDTALNRFNDYVKDWTCYSCGVTYLYQKSAYGASCSLTMLEYRKEEK